MKTLTKTLSFAQMMVRAQQRHEHRAGRSADAEARPVAAPPQPRAPQGRPTRFGWFVLTPRA